MKNFTGIVNINSELNPELSEKIVFNLNPQREQLLRVHTGWQQVWDDVLDLKVPEDVIIHLQQLTPNLQEPKVKYPDKYKGISEKRNGYRYYKCILKNNPQILVYARIANNPLRKHLALVSNCNIIETLKLRNGDKVIFQLEDIPFQKAQFFFNEKREHIALENNWRNSHIFVVAGGPSFKDFPHKNKLKFVQTICINNSPKSLMPYCRPNFHIIVDSCSKFLYTTWQDPQTMKIIPDHRAEKELWNSDLGLPVGKKIKDCPNIVYYRRNGEFNSDTFLTENTVNWGNSSELVASNGVNGKRSVFISTMKILYVLGFRHVYLLGVDFNMAEGKYYSFNEKKHNGAINSNNASYRQMDYWFNLLQPKFLKAGFNVYNCNKDSKLTAFPYMPFEEAFNKALYYVTDSNKYIKGELENTAGLYNATWLICPKCKSHYMSPEDEAKKGYRCKCGQILTEKEHKNKNA